MKKISFFIMLAISMMAFAQKSVAQKEKLTTKTATVNMGYTILNAGEAIIIYKYVHRSHSPKEAEKYAPKYFFITAASDELQPLTKTKLKEAFPTNHPFHDALDATFREDKELVLYDDFHKMYKISHLLMMNSK